MLYHVSFNEQGRGLWLAAQKDRACRYNEGSNLSDEVSEISLWTRQRESEFD